MTLKLPLLILLFGTALAYATPAQDWKCSAQTGLMGATLTQVRLEKKANGYAVYLTDSSGDTGKSFQIKDQMVADEFDCKFSANFPEPLYCVAMKNGWATLTAERLTIQSVDQTTGLDKITQGTSIILSGTSPVLSVYKSSVLKFSASTCTRN